MEHNVDTIGKHIVVMEQAARAGGEVLRKYFGAELVVKEKSIASDLQTRADTESEAAVVNVLCSRFPAHAIQAEESGLTAGSSGYTFVIDPLDGTNNFVLGIPYFSVTIALLQGNVVCGAAVYDPIRDSLYRAQKGQGAFVGEARLRVSAEINIARATVTSSVSYIHNKEQNYGILRRLYIEKSVKRVLSMWSPSLGFCLLASGKLEAAIVNGIELYDCLPGKLIMREAGALITDWQGGADTNDTNNTFIAANTVGIQKEILDVLS